MSDLSEPSESPRLAAGLPTATILALLLLAALGAGCVGLEYPSYWDFDDNLLVNVVTLPVEILITPVIFLLKLLPVL